MSFQLSGLFHGSTSNTAENISNSDTVSEGFSSEGKNSEARNFLPGQTISGEVVANDGNEIQIQIAKAQILTARLEQALSAVNGQHVTFEVKSNSGGTLALRPLFENLTQDTNVSKALSMSGLPVSEKSIQMVNAMMEEGMSVGKDALQRMYHQVMEYSSEEIPKLVSMSKLQIPLTAENLRQFEAYQNYEHKLVDGFQEVLNLLPDSVEQIFSEEGTKKGMLFLNKLLQSFNSISEEGIVRKESMPNESSSETVNLQEAVKAEAEYSENGKALNKEFPLSIEKQQISSENVDEKSIGAGEKADIGDIVQNSTDKNINRQFMRDLSGIADLWEKAGATEEQVELLRSGKMKPDNFFQAMKEITGYLAKGTDQLSSEMTEGQHAAHTAHVKNFFQSEGFMKLFADKMNSQWLLTPENVGKEKEVPRFYERLGEQLKQAAQALSDVSRQDSPLMKTLGNIRENVDFMQQLNQTYTYVQLPLKLQGNKTHGELYVYTNKKNLAKKDGNISALLHLDMEHLGMVDVYVKMNAGKLTTNFYLEDESALDLIEKNISKLTERLTKRGYHVSTNVSMKEGQKTVMDELLQSDQKKIMVSQFAFDVRA